MAELSESRSNRLLESNISLHNLSRRQILNQYDDFDLIIEALQTPYDTIVQGRPNASFFEWRKDSLSDKGRAIFILHTSHWPAGTVQSVIAAALESFPHAQLWLPPNGVDDLILMVGNQPFVYTEFEEALSDYTPDALINEATEALASKAVAGRTALEAWTSSATSKWLHPSDSPALPVLHISELHTHISTPATIWSDLTVEQMSAITPELEAKKRFLSILSQASEGQIQDVFLNASELLDQGFGSQDALTTLVEPHLRDARKHIKIAVRGPKFGCLGRGRSVRHNCSHACSKR